MDAGEKGEGEGKGLDLMDGVRGLLFQSFLCVLCMGLFFGRPAEIKCYFHIPRLGSARAVGALGTCCSIREDQSGPEHVRVFLAVAESAHNQPRAMIRCLSGLPFPADLILQANRSQTGRKLPASSAHKRLRLSDSPSSDVYIHHI